MTLLGAWTVTLGDGQGHRTVCFTQNSQMVLILIDARRVGGVATSSGVAGVCPVFPALDMSRFIRDKYFVTSGDLLWLNFDSYALIGQFNEPGHEWKS
jgi:hypothetical protein